MTLANTVWRWPILFAGWTLLGLSFAAQLMISSSHTGVNLSWRQAVGGALGDWYAVAVLSAPTVLLARRFPFSQSHWRKNLLIHTGAAVAFSAAFMVLRAGIAQWQGWAAARAVPFGVAFQPLLVKTWLFNLIIYAVIVAVVQALGFYRESQERLIRALELEKRLAEARLMALQMQLNPHFLFNALNSIASLIHKDPEAADLMLVRLARLLRLTLDRTADQVVPLRAEIELVQSYLEIECVRFGDRLAYRIDADDEALPMPVPTLVLQPLVENSIKHGLSGRVQRGLITIAAKPAREKLRMEITDNGAGLSNDKGWEEGIGLSNTRARLAQLYGADHRFSLEAAPGGGTTVRIEIPIQAGRPVPENETEDIDR